MTENTQDTTYAKDADLARRFRVSRATVWRWVHTRGFPQPVRFGDNCTRWKMADVLRWETERAA